VGQFPIKGSVDSKRRTVLAVNKAAEKEGLTIGGKCWANTPKEIHAVCKADVALKEQKGVYALNADKSLMAYWIPVEGYADTYMHFSIRF
jgi:hypothetical protein